MNAIGISGLTVQLDTGAGDITAQLTTPPRVLQASSGAGDITITVPNVTYDLSASPVSAPFRTRACIPIQALRGESP